MTVRIGDVWDSTTDVLAGRAGLLTPIAALSFFLPAATQGAVKAYGGVSAGAAALGAVVAILALIGSLWGQMAVIGIASAPEVTRHVAVQAARRRLGPALLVTLVLVAIALVAAVPIVGALLMSGYDFAAAAAETGSAGPQPIPPGTALFVVLYGLVLLVAGLWFSARLAIWLAVVLHERTGIGAIGRSLALTRGLTMKLIGVALIFGLVYLVALAAAQFVVTIVFRLVLGPAQIATATFLGALAGAAVSAAFSVVVACFAARLYAALVGRAPAGAPPVARPTPPEPA